MNFNPFCRNDLLYPQYVPPRFLNILLFCQQKEEGKVQGQLNHTDSSQYIRDLKSQIEELKHEVRLLEQVR